MRYDGPGFYGLNPPLWASGAAQQPAGQWVTSPADKEIYQRIAATNSSTTDPADDVTNYVARSYMRVTSLQKSRVFATTVGVGASGPAGATAALAGAIAVGARTLALNITGRGSVSYLAAFKDASGSLRTEILVDGRTLIDDTPSLGTGTGALFLGSPVYDSTTTRDSIYIAGPIPNALQFRRSLQVYLTASSGAGGAFCGVAYVVGGVA